MALAFSELCALLDNLEVLESAQPPLLAADKHDRLRCTAEAWFRSHRNTIDKLDTPNAVALLSALLPERRPDRVYGLQATSLCRVLSRCLGLGTVQSKYLLAYKQPGRGDLAACLQRVLDQGGPPALPKVSLLEVDELLNSLASQCRFADPTLQAQAPPSSSSVRDRQLGTIFKRLAGRDAKWLVRIIVKDLSPVAVDDRLVLKCFHFLLPNLLCFQQNLLAAITSLRTDFHQYSSTPDPRSERLLKVHASLSLKPLVNVKVSRPNFAKARSIEHCLQMLGRHAWVMERKYDGEYAEIHVDLSRSSIPEKCIKIFAKSGKDATQDRIGIHATLVKCLRLGKPDCKIRRRAILLGELVAWSDNTRAVLPFEEIRKHVTRSGAYIGTNKDDRPAENEHLCIVFFDLLLLDDNVVMTQPIEKRRLHLKSLYDKIPGRAKSAEWKIVDFGQGKLSQRILMEHFAASNAQRCEGLVFKPCGLPYYNIDRDPGRHFQGYIKLKKDYIAGLGDEADFAVVGASYNAQEAAKSRLHNLRWTDFYLGTIVNKEAVNRYAQRPIIRIVGSISQQHCIPPVILHMVNKTAVFSAVEYKAGQAIPAFDIEGDHLGKIGSVFTTPLVFEVLGSGFVKHSDCDYFMLRHPRVTKLHQDRSWKECVGFDELQQLAAESRERQIDSESQENKQHLARLEKTLRRKFEKQATLSSGSKKTTTSPPTSKSAESPCRSLPSPSTRKPLAALAVNSRQSNSSGDHTGREELEGTAMLDSPPCRTKRSIAVTGLDAVKTAKRICQEANTQTSPSRLARRSRTDSTIVKKISRMTAPSNSRALTCRQRQACMDAGCVLAKAAVYLTPCIATTPYIFQDLLITHDATITTSWRDWVREADDPGGGSLVVAESQAYAASRKVILVEVNRQAAYREVVNRLLDNNVSNANAGDIEIWDWRLLESLRNHDSRRTSVLQHLVGVLRWDDIAGCSLFEVLVAKE